MIEKLDNHKIEVAKQIRLLFQASYSVEAQILGAIDFPPLKRSLESYQKTKTTFLGCFEDQELAGITEIETHPTYIDINSLVVHPRFFRRGIASKLLEFLFHRFKVELFIVETGVKNQPAIALYKKHGFKEIKEWDTDFGIRKIAFERRGHLQ